MATPNRIGMRFNSVFEQENMDPFTGMDRVKRDLKEVKAKFGLIKGKTVPVVSGANDAAKLASLLTALEQIGLIDLS